MTAYAPILWAPSKTEHSPLCKCLMCSGAPTQHQMVNIGNGNDPNAPLRYVARVRFENEIGTREVRTDATSQIEAEEIISNGIPKSAAIHELRILGR